MTRSEHTIELPIVEVTLSEDRARVVRRGTLTLDPGEHRIHIRDVSPVLADKTLSASSDGAQATNVTVHRERVLHPHEERPEVEPLWRAWEAFSDRVRGLRASLELARNSEEDLRQVQDAALRTIELDAAWGSASAHRWKADLAAARARREQAAAERQRIEAELEVAHEELQRLHRRVSSLVSPRSVLQAHLSVDVTSKGGAFELQVAYTVPGAAWRPYHRAVLRDGELELQSDACVWQNTGEDWRGAQLFFSTERASLGTEPPPLQEDVLASRKRDDAVHIETREQQIFTTGVAESGASQAPELPGIDDGGEALRLRAQVPADVPSDGRPYRVRVGAFTCKAELEHVLRAELLQAVVLRSTQRNEGPLPVLAGPVDLVRESGFVGRTSVLYVAPGEKFELSWGPDAELRVHRRTTEAKEEKAMLSSWRSQVHRVQLYLSNLGPVAKRIAVRERVPVSEVDKVEIRARVEETSERKSPDANGFVDWSVTLAGAAQHELALAYEVRKHADVVDS